MLTSILGIRLALLLGKTIPLPAPAEICGALTRVEVTNSVEKGDGFTITFTLGKDKAREYGLLQGGLLDPGVRVVIGVLIGAIPYVLIDGIILLHQLLPGNKPGAATLTVYGKDVSVMLDLEEKNAKFENQPDYIIVMRLLAHYEQYGLVPETVPTEDIPLVVERIPRQNETDLQFIQRLAKRNGYVFYIDPVTLGINKAYWGPENRFGVPQPALSINMGDSSNATFSYFKNDALAPVSSSGEFIEPITKMMIPIPSLPSLRIPPFVTSEEKPMHKTLMRETANDSVPQAALAALSASRNTPDAVKATGSTETVRYGHILRARKLVGVRGVGASYNGIYYVSRVTHKIEPGSYVQDFELSREGTGSLLPVVMP